jgi:hypothetical protein
MPKFLTRHPEGFSLTSGHLDQHCSPYAASYPSYPEKIAALAQVIGTDQFLWVIDIARGFPHYEMCKLAEWEVEVPEARILGYIDEDQWFAFVQSDSRVLPPCFSADRLEIGQVSVLLPFPLHCHEIVLRRVYRWISPDKADILSEVKFQTEGGIR